MTRVTTVVLAIWALTTDAVQPSAAQKGCTTTTTTTYFRQSTSPYWPQCSFDGTLRIYSSTVTMNEAVDCHGCAYIRAASEPNVHCPAKIIEATETESTPYTAHRTVCAASTSHQVVSRLNKRHGEGEGDEEVSAITP
ncbi:hypothetical protein J3458_005358 [Metarhizium acridum]|uniref:Uncharacterized protein n=1 Tax=Metarhizium acridum (strain CQMa 102) TaxID=655827 RepID=E9EE57_METAQ|nr:uncharacterized protein MAC_08155 [Metarhizium acridum CQMa 102]EFY85770.1 hypothetical protein MAC_08155 [Metarhizium acridum CQMa 102]KAG8417905.1 hypothetical protein J3458_005358 [Metarhizium acridum]